MKNQSAIKELVDLVRSRIDTSQLRSTNVVVGVFYTGVKLSTGHGGVAFTPIHDIPEAVCCPRSYGKMPDAGHLDNSSLDEILNHVESQSQLKRAIAVAAINAVSQKILFDGNEMYAITYDADPLDLIRIEKGDSVAMIGAFTPYIKRLEGEVKNLYVIERNRSAMLKDNKRTYPEDSIKKLLPKADIVIVTGATIVNGTIDNILSLSKKAREIALVGPTASMLPDGLFNRGATIMGGVQVEDADRMLKVVGQAGSGYALFKECARKTLFRRDNQCFNLIASS